MKPISKYIAYIVGMPKKMMQAYDEAVEAGAVYDPARMEYIQQKKKQGGIEDCAQQDKIIGGIEAVIQ
jgi:hypothetical protein